MIGPSSGLSSGDDHYQQQNYNVMQSGKRRVLEELDIESICDEVCGHHHPRSSAKRPRYLVDMHSNTPTALLNHEVTNQNSSQNQYATLYDTFDRRYDHLEHNLHHHEYNHHGSIQENIDGSVTRLEVLVVDGTWDEALENFDTAVTQPCSAALTELTSASHEHPLQQQNEQIQSLQNVNFQDTFWDQNQQQQHQATAMSKLQNSDNGRARGCNLNLPHPATPAYEDQENGNLSWLLDFKLDPFIEAPEDKSTILLSKDSQGSKPKFNGHNISNNIGKTTNTYLYDSNKKLNNYEEPTAYSMSSYGLADNRNRCTGPKKPPYTYTELIEHALQERGELTVSAIYQWISEHFPYYKSNDDRWKNSVRHNLSINPHFRKGSKAPHGAGHLWAIAGHEEFKHRQLFSITSIRQALKNEEAFKTDSHSVLVDEVAAATASISQPTEEENVDPVTLESCAEQILSGIKREVEVQYLVPMMVSNNGDISHSQQCQQNGQSDQFCAVKETDFLNPVSKEVVAEECGLIGESYLVTDLNPSSLGLNMAESEVVTSDNLFGEELSFQFYEFASPSLQST